MSFLVTIEAATPILAALGSAVAVGTAIEIFLQKFRSRPESNASKAIHNIQIKNRISLHSIANDVSTANLILGIDAETSLPSDALIAYEAAQKKLYDLTSSLSSQTVLIRDLKESEIEDAVSKIESQTRQLKIIQEQMQVTMQNLISRAKTVDFHRD